MSKYNFELDMEDKNALSIICGYINPDTTILEFGAAHGRLTKYLNNALNCTVDIIEIDEQAGQEAEKYARKSLCGTQKGDIESYYWETEYEGNSYDFIILADILEHLKNPNEVLERVKKLLKEDGQILVSIPNIAHNSILVNLYNNQFNYTEIGILDNTHLRFWGKYNFEKDCKTMGYDIKEIEAVQVALYNTEQEVDVDDVSDVLQTALNMRDYGDVYQWIYILEKKQEVKIKEINSVKLKESALASFLMTIYIDDGSGYSECRKRQANIILNKEVEHIFDLSEYNKIEKIRIDPIKGKTSKVMGLKVYSEFCQEEALPLNSLTNINDCDYFETKTPYYEIALSNNMAKTLKLRLTVELLGNQELLFQRRRLYYDLQNVNIITQKQLEQAQVELNQAQVELNQAQVELNQAQVELNQAQGELGQVQGELKQNQIQLKNEQDRIMQIEDALHDTENKLENTVEAFSILQREALDAKEAYKIISQSQIWKATKPLRSILDRFKSTMVGNVSYKFCKKNKEVGIREAIGYSVNYLKLKMLNGKGYESKIIYDDNEKKDIFYKIICECDGIESKVYLPEKLMNLKESKGKNILLISHELSITGAPVALHDMARTLKALSYIPIIVSPYDGKMAEEFVKDEIPIVVAPRIKAGGWITEVHEYFQVIVANTAVTYYAINELSKLSTDTIWWIHEAYKSYTIGGLEPVLPEYIPSNIHVFCGGDYAKEVLKKWRPQYNTEVLLYGITDFSKRNFNGSSLLVNAKKEGKRVFAIVGTFEERKAQDIFASAINMLPNEIRRKCHFLFIGKWCNENVNQEVELLLKKYPKNTQHVEEISREELFSLYNDIDCVVCTSKDDPMPIFVTEAMISSKVIICSEFTGMAKLLQKNNGGLIYFNNSATEVKDYIIKVTLNWSELEYIKKNARRTYEEYYTQEIFKKNLENILLQFEKGSERYYNGTVSIIIPTYKPQKGFEKNLETLRRQCNINKVEIIMVDSSESELEAEIVSQVDKIIQINQNEFSHSYSRNLGAANANGEIIVFMTQDALPNNFQWLSKLIYPIWAEEKVVATSCLEICPEDADLYYKLSSRLHCEFLNAIDEDVYGQYSTEMNNLEVRRNASLNDVSCAIDKTVFARYQYRFNYAEDLDLGIRLIKDGYKIKILGSVRIIHGHSRGPGYYLKRSIIENLTLKKILTYDGVRMQPKDSIFNQIITAYAVASKVFKQIDNHKFDGEQIEEGLNCIRISFNETIVALRKKGDVFKEIDMEIYGETIISDFIEYIHTSKETFSFDETIIGHTSYFFQKSISPYLKAKGNGLDGLLAKEIKSTILKHICVLCGVVISEIEDISINHDMEQLSQGV